MLSHYSGFLANLHQVYESALSLTRSSAAGKEGRSNLLIALPTQESRFTRIHLISHFAEIRDKFSHTLVVETGAKERSHVRDTA